MNGDAALGLVVLGGVLIAVECNRPGRVLPGAAGLLLLLWGLRQLALVTSGHLWMVAAAGGVSILLLLWWMPLRGIPGVLGTSLLLFAMWTAAAGSAGRVSAPWAMVCGLILGVGSSVLLYVAGRARRAKQTRHRAGTQTAGSPGETGVHEHWGVD